MLYFSALLIQVPLLIICGRTCRHLASASRTSRGGLQSLLSGPVSTPSARVLSTQAFPKSYNQTNSTTSKLSYPAKTLENPGKECFIEDCANYPNATKTVDQYGGDNHAVPGADLEQLCVLWNNSCAGNITWARNEFFANYTADTLTSNQCFLNQPTDPSGANKLGGCYEIESSQRLLRFGQAKKWMRSPQCLSDAAVWSSSVPSLAGLLDNFPHADPGVGSCCGKCAVSVQNVDIYYWPEVDVDTSCLDIIGNSSKPLDYGATTTSLVHDLIGRSSSTVIYSTYWGCTGRDSSITTTAYLTQFNSITFKASSYNPWSSPPCPRMAPPSVPGKAYIAARGTHASIRARAHSLIIQPTVIQNNSLPMSTLVLDNFTL